MRPLRAPWWLPTGHAVVVIRNGGVDDAAHMLGRTRGQVLDEAVRFVVVRNGGVDDAAHMLGRTRGQVLDEAVRFVVVIRNGGVDDAGHMLGRTRGQVLDEAVGFVAVVRNGGVDDAAHMLGRTRGQVLDEAVGFVAVVRNGGVDDAAHAFGRLGRWAGLVAACCARRRGRSPRGLLEGLVVRAAVATGIGHVPGVTSVAGHRQLGKGSSSAFGWGRTAGVSGGGRRRAMIASGIAECLVCARRDTGVGIGGT
ncbi:MAG: hypothetical protein MUF54_22055 [Polyangiaceae bacterium]|nr:hypothetical protein [Polyangiaceae bacterium]